MPALDHLHDLSGVRAESGPAGSLVVTLDRPDRLNAITTDVIVSLERIIDAVDADHDVRSVVLTGAGRGFCAGLDLGDAGRAPGSDGAPPLVGQFLWQDHLATLHERIHRSRTPWIAAVNGAAVGGGFALALACDIRIASRSARFGAVFIKIGVSNCDMGTSYLLPRLVGASRSAELLLTARIFDADEADRIGLLSALVDDDDLLARAAETAEAIAQHPPFGTWMTKETMWQTLDAPSMRAALDIENRTQIMCAAALAGDPDSAAYRDRHRRS